MRFCLSGPELSESHLSRCGQLEAACGIGGGESSCFGLFPTTFDSSSSQPSSGCDPHEPATRLSLILSTSTAFTGSTRSTISSSTAALPAVAVWWRSICIFHVSIRRTFNNDQPSCMVTHETCLLNCHNKDLEPNRLAH